jgi:hypothetical protein
MKLIQTPKSSRQRTLALLLWLLTGYEALEHTGSIPISITLVNLLLTSDSPAHTYLFLFLSCPLSSLCFLYVLSINLGGLFIDVTVTL